MLIYPLAANRSVSRRTYCLIILNIISCTGERVGVGSVPRMISPASAAVIAIRSSMGRELIVLITWGVMIKVVSMYYCMLFGFVSKIIDGMSKIMAFLC